MSSEKDAGALFDEITSTAQPEAQIEPKAEVAEPAAVKEEVPPTATPETKSFDPASLPEEARSHYDRELKAREAAAAKWEADFKALHGRVAGLQRENAQLKQGRQAPKPVPAAGNATTAPKKADAFFASEKWGRVKQEFPEVSEPLEELITSLKAEHAAERDADRKALAETRQMLDSIAPNVERVTEFHSRFEAERAAGSVLEKHPDFNEHLKIGYDPDTDEAWIDSPSPQLKEYLDSRSPLRRSQVINQLLSTDPAEPEAAMAEFKEWRDLKFPKGEPSKPEPSARLKASVTPIVKGRGAAAVGAERFDNEGDYFDALHASGA